MSHISRSTLIIAIFFGIDKVFALARQVLIGRLYTTAELDVFLAANNIPDLLSVLISGGALGVALIPVLSEYLENRGRKDAWDLFTRILNLAFIVTGVLAILIALFAEPVINHLIAPGFTPEKKALAVELMRLDLVAIMVFSISGLAMAGLQANQHFLLPAMAPVLYNVGQIIGILVFSPQEAVQLGPVSLPSFGLGIYGLVYGVILGSTLHLAIQVPGLLRFGFRWRPVLGLRTPGVRKVLLLLGPRVVTMAFIQWFFLVRDNLASRMGEGAVTGLNYGWFMMQVPETLIGSALAIAILPTLAEHFVHEDLEAFKATLNRGIQAVLLLTIPVAAIFAAGIEPVIDLIGLEPHVADLAVLATRVYLLGLTGHALLEIASRSFYARQDAVTPLIAAFLNAVLLYSLLAAWLSGKYGVGGIALANSLAFTIEAVMLFFLLHRKIPGFFKVRSTVVRAVTAALVGAGVVFLANTVLGTTSRTGLVEIALGAVALAAGGLAMLPVVWKELRQVVRI